MSSTPRPLNLTERDFDLLRLAATGQVFSLDQAHTLYWPDAERSTAQARLARLVAGGLLQSAYTNARGLSEQIYCLTHDGAGLLTPMEQQRADPSLPGRATMRQQLDAQDTRIKLTKYLAGKGERILKWRTEAELRGDHIANIRKMIYKKGRKLKPDELAALPDIPDAEAFVERIADGATYKMLIEIDGAYYGALLEKKICGMRDLARKNKDRVIWATSAGPGRVQHIKEEIKKAEAQGEIVILRV